MKQASLFIILLAVLSFFVICFNRLAGRVLERKRAAIGEGMIVIREMQRSPLTMAGLLGLGDCIHRCEYVPHSGWPSTSSISFVGESYVPSKFVIEWSDFDSAKVSLDNQAEFYLVNGVWRKDAP